MFLTLMRPSLVLFLVLWLKLVKDFLKVRCRLALLPFLISCLIFFFQAEDGIRDVAVTGVQTCALPILGERQLLVGGGRQRQCRVLREQHGPAGEIHGDRCRAGGGDVGDAEGLGQTGLQGRRSEERRVGKEGRRGGAAGREKEQRRESSE